MVISSAHHKVGFVYWNIGFHRISALLKVRPYLSPDSELTGGEG
jgi:hypothetical protein